MATRFSNILMHWYSVNKRSLPWRETTHPYPIWLSEIILQQTQVAQGLPYYESFLSHYPTVFHLARAEESEVLKLWQGLGYYSRARNLHATAKFIVNELQGEFPKQYKDLIKLKGVGDYTASAIASICFNEPAAVVDGNVYRVLSRYFGISTPVNTAEGTTTFKRLAQDLIDKDRPAQFNQAIMEFGAIQCRPKNPDCKDCPLNAHCVAYHQNKVDVLPIKLKKTRIKKRYFNFLVFLSNDGKTVLEKRTDKGIWQNLYQFPLIETKKETGYKTLKALLKDHKMLKDKKFELHLFNDQMVIHKLSHQHLYTKFWILRVDNLEDQAILIRNIHNFAVPVLIGNFIEAFNF
ncbi:A/G-specific adenine glycosylase [Aestuariivivens sediminicola]|uniref:A/G-specific adenine glycosylase n=1 Tax=Aestuariivivens sediminicola TaxID=2913560 RepID=UPI002412D8BB|nr:A/G-specific adenine glycosylase [Aestuariivivens sediminicola]